MGKIIEIIFGDLIDSKKDEILKEFEIGGPEEMNLDIVPIAIIQIETDSEKE